MSFDAGSIVGKLKMDRSGFTAGILEAQGLTKMLGPTIGSFLANPLLGVAGAATSAFHSISNLVRSTANSAAEFGRMSAATGASVQWLSGMKYAAESCHVPFEELSFSLDVLMRNAADSARGTSGTAVTFRQLGISVQDAGGHVKNAQQLFADTAGALGNIQDPAMRAALAMELFGRGGKELLPMLAQGQSGMNKLMQEAKDLGLVMDDKAVESAKHFNHALHMIDATMDGLKQQIAIPMFETLADPLMDLSRSLGTELKPAMREINELLANMLGLVKPVAQGIGALAGAVNAAHRFLYPNEEADYHHTPNVLTRGGQPIVNVTVSPEDSAAAVARKLAPVIQRNVGGVQRSLERQQVHLMDLHDFENSSALR